jgi:uncharacterized protein (DUF983 family)
MKYECPHCHQRSIPALAKLFSVAHAPVKCKLCGGLSTEPPGKRGILGLIYYIGFLVAIGYAFATWSWWPIVAFVVGGILLSTIALHLVPLAPVTEAIVKREYRFRMLAIGGFLLLFLVAALIQEWK